MGDDGMTYDASHITVLEGAEAVRKRPGMYIGSTGPRGLHHMVTGVVEWAADVVLAAPDAGSRRHIAVTLAPDGGVRVTDDGPGVPFAAQEAPGAPGVPPLDEQLSRFGPGPRRRAFLLNGWELMTACALSTRLTAEVRREGVRRVQNYIRGTATAPPADAGPAADSGTAITFHPDPEIFTTVEVDRTVLADRLRELAFLTPGLTLTLTDERPPGPPRTARFHSPAGVAGLLAHLDGPVAGATEVVTVSVTTTRGALDAALRRRGPAEGPPVIRSYANCFPTAEGGVHVEGLRDGLTAALAGYARAHGLPEPDAEGACAGLTAVVSVRLDAPSFEGSTHGRLGNTEVRPWVAAAVREHVGAWLDAHPEQAAGLLGG
ncbi:DNA gyrase subunit B [Streptomyces sp. NPDC021224]|uniref:DNA gyrase subunit B n=1 Tax=unclassified Streptomyces TaxID=2593676 RepID=UPI0037B14107